jgi:4-amino-4-deoxy-L-arabinose transferase-like glycosyltransferase
LGYGPPLFLRAGLFLIFDKLFLSFDKLMLSDMRIPPWLDADRPWRDRLVLAAITIALLSIFWVSLPPRFQANQNFDYTCCYEPLARDWIDGKGFVNPNGSFAIHYPPGFSVLLAGVFLLGRLIGEGLAMNVFIVLCDVTSVFAVYACGRVLGGAWLGRIAGLCLITYPFFLWMSKQPNSEGPFLPLILWAFYGYLRLVSDEGDSAKTDSPWKWAAFIGALWGLAALVRPIGILGACVAGGSLILFSQRQVLQKRILLAGAMVVINLAVVLPWEVIVWRETGRWILLGDNPGSYLDGLTFGLPLPSNRPPAVSPEVRELMERALAQQNRVMSVGGLLGFMMEEARTHPGSFLKLIYLKATRAWYGTHEGYFERINGLISIAYILAASFGLWRMRRDSKTAEASGILALVGYFWLMATLVLPILRYMVPATAVLILAVAVMVKGLFDAPRSSGLLKSG